MHFHTASASVLGCLFVSVQNSYWLLFWCVNLVAVRVVVKMGDFVRSKVVVLTLFTLALAAGCTGGSAAPALTECQASGNNCRIGDTGPGGGVVTQPTQSTILTPEDGLDAQSPGVTDTSIKIGYYVGKVSTVGASLGFKQANYGDVTKQIQAYAATVNANGGLGGRQIIPVIKTYDGSLDNPEYAESFCNAFTQDEQVFAVVFEGQLQNNVRPCYATRKTIMIDQGLLAKDQTEFERFAPYLWSPTFPEYGGYLKTQLQTLQSAGWLTGAKGVSIIGIDNDVARRQIDQSVIPFLASVGITNTQKFFIDTANIGSLGAGSSTALTGTANAGLDRVLVVGGGRILPIAVTTSEANDLVNVKWAISSYDSPLFLQDNPTTVVAATLDGMIGFGALPDGDIRDDPALPFPNPANTQEVLCKQIVDTAGVAPVSGLRTDYKSAFMHCDGTFFLKAVIDRAPKNLTAGAFRDAAFGLGSTFRSSQTFGSLMSPGKYSATNVGRALYFDKTCDNPITKTKGCFRYQGGDVPFS